MTKKGKSEIQGTALATLEEAQKRNISVESFKNNCLGFRGKMDRWLKP